MSKIYSPLNDHNVRFDLGESGDNMLAVIGVNPSCATDKTYDMTTKKVEGISKQQKYDGWLLLNLYPQRSTSPQRIHSKVDAALAIINLNAVSRRIEEHNIKSVLCAWGNTITFRPFLYQCLADIYSELAAKNLKWLSIGPLTKLGHPRHPSRCSYATELNSFDVQKYIQTKPRKL